jgi:hypothetical protein
MLMSERFDPYHKWLGIPPKDQPPTHYRLLGIEVFEADPDVIESAADQRMTHVRSFQSGSKVELTQRILNEIATARLCLLNPTEKEAYDRQLRGQMTAADSIPSVPPVAQVVEQPMAAPPMQPVPAAEAVPEPIVTPVAEPSPAQRLPAWQIATALGIFATAVVLSAALLMWGLSVARGRQAAQGRPGNAGAPSPDSPVPPESVPGESPLPPDSGSADRQPPQGHSPDAPTDEPLPSATDGGNGLSPHSDETTSDERRPDGPSATAEDKGQASDGETTPSADGPGETTSADASPDPGSTRAAVPAPADQQQALRRIGFVIGERSAAELLAIANHEEDLTPATRFAIFVRAKETAANAGNVPLALDVIDRMATLYAVDPFELKTEMLIGVGETPDWPRELQDVSHACLALVDEATLRGNRQLAQELAALALSSARRAKDWDLTKLATHHVLKLREQAGP